MMGWDSKIQWTDHTFNPWRLLGWLWLPVPWIWRGCWDREAACEAWRQGWREFVGVRPIPGGGVSSDGTYIQGWASSEPARDSPCKE